MKRLIPVILAMLLLCGCGVMGERIKDPVTFYYVREDYEKDMTGVMASETREASGHREDLPYLLALYSMGPSTEGLQALFPASISIIPTEHAQDGIVLNLSEVPESMTDAEYTLASVCLARTCMELSGASQITVISPGRTVTVNEGNVLLQETGPEKQLEESK